MVLLKGIVASNLSPRWHNPRSIYCPRSYSDRFTVILSSPIIAVRSFVRLLSLRGGGGFPAWTLGVECTCCVDTTLAVPLSVASHDLPAYQQVWTEHTVPQPSVRFVVLICGGAFRPNDYSSMMRKVMPQLLVIVIDWAVGGHQHDYEIESVNLWICSLVGSALCLLVIAGPECGPWCALRGVGAGPGILFSLDFPDGKLDETGVRLPAATAVINNLTSLAKILVCAHNGGSASDLHDVRHTLKTLRVSICAPTGTQRHSRGPLCQINRTEHTGRAVIAHGTTARHGAHNTARPHSTRSHRHDRSTRNTPDRRQSTHKHTQRHSGAPLCQINRTGAHGTCGDRARHDRTARPHGMARTTRRGRTAHGRTRPPPPTRNHQGTAAQRDEGPLPAVPSRLPTQTSTRSAAHDATDHARADVGAMLLTRAHSQTNPSTTSHISRCAALCAQQPHGEWHARPPESTRTSEGTGEGLSGIGASGAHPSGAKLVWEALGKLGPSTLLSHCKLRSV